MVFPRRKLHRLARLSFKLVFKLLFNCSFLLFCSLFFFIENESSDRNELFNLGGSNESGVLGALNEIRRAVGVKIELIFRRITVGGVFTDSLAIDGDRSNDPLTLCDDFGDK